ncbi:MAG: G/U mismatch-specific DNA glycosylase [Candidatus Levybacteria bacterium]|nr:G/U mismatch-specific DNA glycosylase [Candidatus Levybacteria bacterium]
MQTYKPTRDEVLASAHKQVGDIIKPDLKVLFCGINPGLYTAAVGHHFGRPGNRFWKALYASGFTDHLFHPSEQEALLDINLGITNIVPRASATAAEVSTQEFLQGRKELTAKVLKYQPKWLAVLGIQAYRQAFDEPKAQLGLQDKKIGETKIWVLPNPSGLNAHYTVEKLSEVLREFKKYSDPK